MPEFPYVTTLADLDTLDTDEVIEGYFDGRDGWPEPGNNRTRSYWHGWRNGVSDSTGKPDKYQWELARLYVARSRAS